MEVFQPETFTQLRYPVHQAELAHELGRVRVQNPGLVHIHDLGVAGITITQRMFRHPNQCQMVFHHLQYSPAIISPLFPDNRISAIQIVLEDYLQYQFNVCLATKYFLL